ncbi:alpha/beta hydrolase [uncultured Corynebacterium sp.]|uniref:alpha/beta hydrolase n=1 Tax=uncultured Corynebacterium sp. TaxID=159447 RepID=UPI0025E95FFD|nr:alpha/beta hydrolase [uncultured Corynebacterium sp.]
MTSRPQSPRRFRRALHAGVAAALALPLMAGTALAQPATGSADVGLGPEGWAQAPIEAPAMPAPAGTIRADFGAPGPHDIDVSEEVGECDDLIYGVYADIVENTMNVNERPSCYDTFPGGAESPVGVKYYYPSELTSDEGATAPLMVFSPGIGANPGMYDRQARLYASHGYVVAMGYSFLNWFGYQVELAAKGAVDQSLDTTSPLHGKVDFSRTMLVGQSAGGGSVARMGGLLDGAMNDYSDVDFRTAGMVPLMNAASDFGTLSPAPSVPALFALAEHESLVPWPFSRLAYDRHTGSAWWTIIKGVSHGSYLDHPKYNAAGALVLSFSEYVAGAPYGKAPSTPDVAAVYEGDGYRLASDPELMATERKGA